mmetsp:Transcript_117918/g.333509  ORF Transcript_117918/g.333509 Transcript_117918/m.333509 type:complete len:342 (+) Transcript_117918:581-1606(+)
MRRRRLCARDNWRSPTHCDKPREELSKFADASNFTMLARPLRGGRRRSWQREMSSSVRWGSFESWAPKTSGSAKRLPAMQSEVRAGNAPRPRAGKLVSLKSLRDTEDGKLSVAAREESTDVATSEASATLVIVSENASDSSSSHWRLEGSSVASASHREPRDAGDLRFDIPMGTMQAPPHSRPPLHPAAWAIRSSAVSAASAAFFASAASAASATSAASSASAAILRRAAASSASHRGQEVSAPDVAASRNSVESSASHLGLDASVAQDTAATRAAASSASHRGYANSSPSPSTSNFGSKLPEEPYIVWVPSSSSSSSMADKHACGEGGAIVLRSTAHGSR